MNCSMPGFPVLLHLLELIQIHVHWVTDAIQLSYLLSLPFSAFSLSQQQGFFPMSWLFTLGGHSIGNSASASVLPMNISGLISFKIDWFDPLVVQGTFISLPSTALQRHQFFGILPSLRSSSVQLSSVAQSCPNLWPHESQHVRPPCPSPTPRVYPNSCPSSRWCHQARKVNSYQ